MKKQLVGKRFWVSGLIFAACVLVLYKLVDNFDVIFAFFGRLLQILKPFIIGFVIAFLLYAPTSKLENLLLKAPWGWMRKMARGLSVLVVYLVLAGLLALMIATAIPALVSGITGLIAAIPDYYQTIQKWVNNNLSAEWVQKLQLDQSLQQLYDFLRSRFTVEKVADYVASLVSVTSSIFNVFFVFIVSIYMLLSRESLLNNAKLLITLVLPDRWEKPFFYYAEKTNSIFYKYLYSKLLDTLLYTLLMLPGLLLAGLPYLGALSILIAVFGLIPYFGSLFSMLVCVAIALLNGNPGGALFFAIYNIIVQQVDGNIIQPKLFGQSVGLKPFYVLLAIAVGGGLGGLLGILIGVPVMAVVQMLLLDLIDYLRRRHERLEARRKAAQTEAEPDQSHPVDGLGQQATEDGATPS